MITSWTSPSLSQVPGLAPSYAALDGMGILASSPAELKAVIDAHVAGSNITADPTYKAASAGSLAKPSGIMYLNVAHVVAAVEKLVPASAAIDARTAADLAPLKAFMLTASSQAGAALERFFVAVN